MLRRFLFAAVFALGLSARLFAASGDVLVVFDPFAQQFPASNYATLGWDNLNPVLDFDASTDEAAVFKFFVPPNYSGGGLTIDLYVVTAATSGDFIFQADLERQAVNDLDIDGDSFTGSPNSVTAAADATGGQIVKATITFTSGADMDSITAGDQARLKINRDADNGSDTVNANDVRVLLVVVKES